MNQRRFLGLIFATACSMFMAMPIQAGQPSKQAATVVGSAAAMVISTVPQAPIAPTAEPIPIASSAAGSKLQKKDVKTPAKSSSIPVPGLQGRMLDVMIFTGMGAEENEESSPVTNGFAFAICQHATPLIVSSWVFNNYLLLKSKGKKNFKNIEINPLEWNVYVNKTQTLYTFIPIKYLEKLEKKHAKSIKEYQEKTKQDYTLGDILVGFNLSKLTQLTTDQVKQYSNLSEKKEKNEIVNAVTKHKDIPISDFKDLFVQGRDDIFGMWNIYLIGHGSYPRLEDFTAKSAQLKDISKASIANFTITEYRELINFFTKNIKVNFLYYTTCYGGDYNLILPYMTTLINERDKKSFIVGGIVKPNFTIVAGALTSHTVSYSLGKSLQLCNEITKSSTEVLEKEKLAHASLFQDPSAFSFLFKNKEFISYKDFFDLLHLYGTKSANQPTLYKEAELKKILQEVTLRVTENEIDTHDPYGISALPQVMFPNTDVFRAIPLDDKIAVIGQVLTRKHEIEQKPFIFDDKEALLLYPKDIPVDITIIRHGGKSFPSIVSMQPGIGLHKLTKVFTNNMSFEALMRDCFGSVAPAYKKYYYIEELNLTSDEYCYPPSIPENQRTPFFGHKVTIYNFLIVQEKLGLVGLFVGPNKNRIFYFHYDIETRKLTVHETPLKVTKSIPNNQFLNALFDYFIESSIFARNSVFEFKDIIKKFLLTQEEQDILSKYLKTSAQGGAAGSAVDSKNQIDVKTPAESSSTALGWLPWVRSWCRK